MPICKRCNHMSASPEMRQTGKEEVIEYQDRGRIIKGIHSDWICLEKGKCKARVQSKRAAEKGPTGNT